MAQRLVVEYVRYYTDGTAARKAEPAQPPKTLKLPKAKINKEENNVLRIDPVAVLGIAVSFVMLVLLVVGSVQLICVRQEAAAMARYVHSLEQQNANLQGKFQEKLDLEDVRRTADALGLVSVEQVKHVSLRLPEPEAEQNPGVWERICTFLTGLFA